MDIFKYINDSFKCGSSYIFDIISNYFYRKSIKPYTSHINSTRINNKFMSNYIECNISYLKLDNLFKNFIHFIELNQSRIFFYPSKPCIPITIIVIKNTKIVLKKSFTYPDNQKSNDKSQKKRKRR